MADEQQRPQFRYQDMPALGMVKPKMLGAQARAGKGGRYT